MITNYFMIAIRSLRRHAAYLFTNVVGFAISLACCFIIGLYVKTELSFDAMHGTGNRVYRYVIRYIENGQSVSQAWTPNGLAPLLNNTLPHDVEAVTRLEFLSNNPLINEGDREVLIGSVALADSSFFKVFPFEMREGESSDVLSRPMTIAISQSAAFKNFGTESPIGKIVRYENKFDLEITGVFTDMPVNSHFRYDALISFLTCRNLFPNTENILDSFSHWNTSTYILTRPDFTPETVARDFEETFYATYTKGSKLSEDALIDWWQPLREIHFTHGIKGDYSAGNINNIYMALTLGCLIMVIACFNFMNLSTAMAVRRAKEVGLRKSMGAQRHQLILQFLGETFIQVVTAAIIASFLVQMLLPFVHDYIGLTILPLPGFNYLLIVFCFILVTTLVAGSYPAFFISAYEPVKVLKGNMGGGGKSFFRNMLTTFQFAASIFLTASTWIVFGQLNFMHTVDLGFKTDQIITIYANESVKKNYDGMREKMLSYPRIKDVTASSARLSNLQGFWRYSFPNQEIVGSHGITTLIISDNYLDFMNIERSQGRTLSSTYGTDLRQGYMVNEAFVNEYMLTNPLETEIQLTHDSTTRGTIVGVVKDFHFQPLHVAVQPLVIRMDDENAWLISIALSGDLTEGLLFAESVWKEISGGAPFDYQFMDESIASNYENEQKAFSMLVSLTFFTLAIAMLGLFGLTAFMTLQRRKEIGIRKVLGSSVLQVILLISFEIVRLVGVSFLFAIPFAWYVMRQWLQQFATKIEMSPFLFMGSGFIVLLLAIIVVAYQSAKAGSDNPTLVLRSE